jgi:hypothetical protein
MSLSRTETDLLGSPGSPTSISAGSAATSTALDLTSVAGTYSAVLGGAVIVGGSSPSASPTVTWQYSLDGTNYVNDPSVQSLPTTASTTNYVGPYRPPPEAKKARAVVTNNDAGSVAVTAFVQGTVLASSNL